MKKNVTILIAVTVVFFLLSFVNKYKKNNFINLPIGNSEFTCNGDINFNFKDNKNFVFVRSLAKGIVSIGLTADLYSKDSIKHSLFIISMIGVSKNGYYSLILSKSKDSCFSQVAYSASLNMDKDKYLSTYTTDTPGYILINSLTDTSIAGTYKSELTNSDGKSYNVSGSFSGPFYK